jgi:transcriptional regulator with XRE-family HTH domain
MDRPEGRSFYTAKEVLAEALDDPEFRAEWNRLVPARAVALRLVAYRADHGLTQTALGRRLGMPQPAVARLETGEHVPSLETLIRLSNALDIEFLVDIKPPGKRSSWVSRRAESATVLERVKTDKGGELLVAAS